MYITVFKKYPNWRITLTGNNFQDVKARSFKDLDELALYVRANYDRDEIDVNEVSVPVSSL